MDDVAEDAQLLDQIDSPKPDSRYDPSFLHAAFAAVPEIGKGRRWYDPPYLILSWLLTSWRRRLIPRRARERLNVWLNWFLPFNDYERNKAWSLDDPMHNLTVPADEHISMPALWVVEFFPPSQYHSLLRAIETNEWDRRRAFRERENNLDMLKRSRSSSGWSWWRLAEIGDVNAGYLSSDVTKERLPDEFRFIELRAVQVGTGLTAVVGRFLLNEEASKHLDETWHTRHEPQLVFRRGTRPLSEDRQWASYRITQEMRRAIHDSARDWLANRCPGFFADAKEPQLLVDLLLTDQFDPFEGARASLDDTHALRALGLTDFGVEHRTSRDLPGLVLSAVEGRMCPALGDQRTWAIWGKEATVVASTQHLDLFGSDNGRAIAHHCDELLRGFLVALGISEYLSVSEAKYAEMRDSARTGYRTFRRRELPALRESLLTHSMDLASVSRDVLTFWNREKRRPDMARFEIALAPWIMEDDRRRNLKARPPIDWNRSLRQDQRAWLKEMSEVDRDYRGILATVATLGASADTSKLGRLALVASLASLIVAAVTLGTSADMGWVGSAWDWIRQPF